jgi:hypothetical protein
VSKKNCKSIVFVAADFQSAENGLLRAEDPQLQFFKPLNHKFMNSKNIFTCIIVFATLILVNFQSYSQKKQESSGDYCATDTIKGSPAREVITTIGTNNFTLKYHSPGVKGRTIWGGLVAYGNVWATGAHYATTIEFSQDVIIEGKTVKAGKYAFFTIPNKKNWTLILNKNWDQHLADEYDEKDDILRMTVKPEKLKQIVNRLEYKIEPKTTTNNSENAIAIISMSWEKIKVSFEVQNVAK